MTIATQQENVSSSPRTPVQGRPVHPWTGVRVPGQRRIRRWTKSVWSGLAAGTVALLLEMVLLQASGRNDVWSPVRLSASVIFGGRVVATSVPFSFGIFFVGTLVHYMVAVLYAMALGLMIRKRKPATAALVGAIFGLCLYFLHLYALAALYPWMVNARNWIVIVAQVAFGISAAWFYKRFYMRQLTHDATCFPM